MNGTVEIEDRARWVRFADECGFLRRMIRSDGQKGFVIRFTGQGNGDAVRKRAETFGFEAFENDGSVVLMVPSGRPDFTASELAQALGGETCIMSRREIFAFPWTIDYQKPNLGKPEPEAADKSFQEYLGLNFNGIEVIRDLAGRRFLKWYDDQGNKVYRAEPSGGGGGEFMRAARASDCGSAAAGLLRMADSGTVLRQDFERVAAAACEAAEGDFTPIQAEAAIAPELLRQIVDSASEEDASRASYHKAIRMAENSREIIDAAECAALFQPSGAFLIFLKRMAHDHSSVDFAGSDRLSVAAPTLREAGAAFQLHDLTECGAGLVTMASNILGRRPATGITIFIADPAEGIATNSLRQAIGRTHAVETVANVSPLAATGHHQGAPIVTLVVGERRPKIEESLPAAAARTFEVEAPEDLDSLYLEILRSRRQIRKWHQTVADAEAVEHVAAQTRQRRYVPLSSSTQPFTMIPKALEAATAKALRRTAREFEHLGGVDSAIAERLGVEREELPDLLTSEQIDAVAMSEVARMRMRSFLLADQTGIGKGRSLAAIAALTLRSGGKVLYLSEGAEITVPDVWRDMCAVGAHRIATPLILATRAITIGNPDDGSEQAGQKFSAMAASSRAALFRSAIWPDEWNLIISTYSMFRGKPDSPARQWIKGCIDQSVLLILDESHNAGNGRSNTGASVREMISGVERSNVVFATATPMRSPDGADLYATLLPQAEGNRLDGLLDGLVAGGETAQESFASMLAEDGVYLRRDHDLSNIEYHVRLPDDQQLAAYQQIMDRFSPLVELMLDASLKTGEILGDARSLRFRELIEAGWEKGELAPNAIPASIIREQLVDRSPGWPG